MRRVVCAFLVTVATSVAGAAEQGSGDARTHLGALHICLAEAAVNARVLYQVVDLGAEAVGNLERALGTCDRRLAALKQVAETRRSDPPRFAELERDLREARAQLSSLRALTARADRTQVRLAAASLWKVIERSEEDFGLLSSGYGQALGEASESLDDLPDGEIPDFPRAPTPLPPY